MNTLQGITVTGNRLVRENVSLDNAEMFKVFQHLMQHAYGFECHHDQLEIRTVYVCGDMVSVQAVQGFTEEDWLVRVVEESDYHSSWTTRKPLRKATKDDVAALNVINRVRSSL